MMNDCPFRVLVVDDEPHIRSGLARALASEPYAVGTAGDVEEALAAAIPELAPRFPAKAVA